MMAGNTGKSIRILQIMQMKKSFCQINSVTIHTIKEMNTWLIIVINSYVIMTVDMEVQNIQLIMQIKKVFR